MPRLPQMIPDPDFLLSMQPEELAGPLLFALRDQQQNNKIHLSNFTSTLYSQSPSDLHYQQSYEPRIRVAIAEAWSWLQTQGLLIPDPSINGANGWMIFSRRAGAFATADDISKFASGRKLDKSILNPAIADKVWSAFMRGEYDVAAFQAMKAVEVAVREAGGFGFGDLGIDLMRKAFHEDNGPLTDKSTEKGERQARSALFAGAIGSYKNPHSHREVDLNEPNEALEIVLLANHLLRIVDGRIKAMGNA
jgi:uncharacterized protein (TIGR02391 family)